MAQEDALQAHSQAVQAADVALYQAGFADGVASVPASQPVQNPPDVQAQIDAAVAAKAQDDQAKLDALNSQLQAVQADDDAQKATVAAQKDMLDKVKAALGL